MIIRPYDETNTILVCKTGKTYPFQIHLENLFAYVTKYPYLANLQINTIGKTKRRPE